MKVVHQKQPLLGVIEQFYINHEECQEMPVRCDKCKQKFILCRAYNENYYFAWLISMCCYVNIAGIQVMILQQD